MLEAALAYNRRAGLPPIDVSPAQGKLLQLLAKGIGATRILEIGTLGGYSTIWLARALGAGGRLVTLELDPGYAAVARANIDRAGLGEAVDIRIGPACDTLEAMDVADAVAFDFVFVDADKDNYAAYLDHAIRLARPGAMLVFDNVVREGEILNPDSDDPKVPGTRRLYAALKDNPRIDATAIQTVGHKKWDGFLLALVQGTR